MTPPPGDRPIDRLLARARLAPTAPYTHDDIRAAHERVAARVAARRSGRPVPAPAGSGRRERDPRPGTRLPEHDRKNRAAARDLRVLCETITAHPDALDHLRDFLTDRMPEPSGARVLGCLLYLAACEDSAQFWWEYAASAEDTAAGYCLALHHRAQGEEGVADLWQRQADPAPAPDAEETDQEIAATLRMLGALKPPHRDLPPAVSALVAYIPAAVAVIDDDLDLGLPLPDPDFPDHITTLTTADSTPSTRPRPPGQPDAAPPSTRRPALASPSTRTAPAGGKS